MPPTILVVDDEPILRESLAALLMDEEFAVETAGDGRAALELHERVPVDLIVSDVMMPRLDGYALVAELREHGDQTPVILVSAAGRPACSLPGVSVLGKPFNLDTMLSLVASALEERRRMIAGREKVPAGRTGLARRHDTRPSGRGSRAAAFG